MQWRKFIPDIPSEQHSEQFLTEPPFSGYSILCQIDNQYKESLTLWRVMTGLEFLCEGNTVIGRRNYAICTYSVAIYFTFNLFYLEARVSNTPCKYFTKTFPSIHAFFYSAEVIHSSKEFSFQFSNCFVGHIIFYRETFLILYLQ